MSIPEYGFQDRQVMSQGVAASKDISSILLKQIPGSITVEKAQVSDDRTGVDYWVFRDNGLRPLSVDAKVREQDWRRRDPTKDDIALEYHSVVDIVPGWTRDPHKQTDYILFFWKDTQRWMLLPLPMLRAVFTEHSQTWLTTYGTSQQYTPPENGRKGYYSSCIFVPRKLIWTVIYQRYGGSS